MKYAMRNKRWICTAVCGMVLMLVIMAIHLPASAAEIKEELFTKEEQAYIDAAKSLKIGYVTDRKPVSFQDENGELAGISRYIFDRIEKISGLNFEYVALPSGDITYDYLQNENFDLVTSVEYNKENKNARGILISEPYLSSRKVIVAKSGLEFAPDAHFTVAISTGSQTLEKVLNAQYPNFKLVNYPSIQDCLNAVNKGKADLLIQNQYVVEYWLYKPSYQNLIVIPMLEMQDQLCFSAVLPIDKADAEWADGKNLISVIDKSIAQITDSEISGYIIASTMKNMYRYSFSDFIYQYRYAAIILGIAVAVIIVLLVVSLRYRIRSIKARADAKAKGDFLSAMSHEIRTPLNGLISLNYLMSKNVSDQKKIENYLQQSSAVMQYLMLLLNNILDMSKLQEEKIQLEEQPVDLRLLLETVESVERAAMEEKKMKLRLDLMLPYPGIYGDAIRIQQVLINLLDNARKYTSRGGTVEVKVKQHKLQDDQIQTEIEVADTGRGMSEEFQKKIFQPFTQESDTVSQGNQGTGLGLSISALLAKKMNGDLRVESKLGEGSRFTFVFMSKPATLPKETERESAVCDEKTHEKPRILIAEDNDLNGQILTELLEGEDFEVLLVPDGKKAVEAFAASAPGEYGVILMDLLMPEMNGYEATKAIRAMNRPDAATVKIFASTANTLPEDREKAYQSGMDDFIAKPIDIEDLLKKLEL